MIFNFSIFEPFFLCQELIVINIILSIKKRKRIWILSNIEYFGKKKIEKIKNRKDGVSLIFGYFPPFKELAFKRVIFWSPSFKKTNFIYFLFFIYLECNWIYKLLSFTNSVPWFIYIIPWYLFETCDWKNMAFVLVACLSFPYSTLCLEQK